MPLKPPGPIALRAAADALANIGVQEDPAHTNRGPWVALYLADVGLAPGAPWCMAFAYFRFHHAALALGRPLPPLLRTGSTALEAEWARRSGLWIPAPHGPAAAARGDLAFFYHPALGRIAHVGIVTGSDADAYHTVEGNTNTDGDREGYEVCAKTHPWAGIHPESGFMRVAY